MLNSEIEENIISKIIISPTIFRNIYNRKYKNISDLIAKINGVISLIVIICSKLSNYISKKLKIEDIFQNLEKNKKLLNKKENNNCQKINNNILNNSSSLSNILNNNQSLNKSNNMNKRFSITEINKEEYAKKFVNNNINNYLKIIENEKKNKTKYINLNGMII